MRNIARIAAVALVCISVAGCQAFRDGGGTSSPAVDERPIGPNGERLNRIPGTQEIEIPGGISDLQAMDAIEGVIRGTNPGERVNHWASQWRLEGRDPANKWIRIGLTAREHYLSVCYRIEGRKILADVPTSTNLKQDGIKIHRKVPAWINKLRPLILQKLYDLQNDGAGSANAPTQHAAFCPKCGAKADTTAAFCTSCGNKLK